MTRLKEILIVWIMLFVVSNPIWANSDSPNAAPVSVDDLQSPDAPGFVLLGAAPTNVQRPTTPKALVVSLENITQSNFAIEVNPYWLFDHLTLSVDDFYKPDIFQCILQNANISLATGSISSEFNAPKNTSGTGVGIGLKTLLFQGDVPAELQTIKKLQIQWLEDRNNSELATTDIQNLDQAVTVFRNGQKKPEGFSTELDFAQVVDLTGSNYSQATASSMGLWITPSYYLSGPQLDFLVVGRFIDDERNSLSYFDYGLRLVKEFGQVEMSFEYLGRTATNNSLNTNRYDWVIQSPIQTGIYLTASFGKDFQSSTSGNSNLISLLGINFGLGNSPVVIPGT